MVLYSFQIANLRDVYKKIKESKSRIYSINAFSRILFHYIESARQIIQPLIAKNSEKLSN